MSSTFDIFLLILVSALCHKINSTGENSIIFTRFESGEEVLSLSASWYHGKSDRCFCVPVWNGMKRRSRRAVFIQLSTFFLHFGMLSNESCPCYGRNASSCKFIQFSVNCIKASDNSCFHYRFIYWYFRLNSPWRCP